MTDQKQIFCECSKLCDDPFWAQQFTNIIPIDPLKGYLLTRHMLYVLGRVVSSATIILTRAQK